MYGEEIFGLNRLFEVNNGVFWGLFSMSICVKCVCCGCVVYFEYILFYGGFYLDLMQLFFLSDCLV